MKFKLGSRAPIKRLNSHVFWQFPRGVVNDAMWRVAALLLLFVVVVVRTQTATPAPFNTECYTDYVEWDYTAYAHSPLCPAGHTWCGGV